MPSTSRPRCCWNARTAWSRSSSNTSDRDVPAGGQVRRRGCRSAQRRQSRPDLGDRASPVTATQTRHTWPFGHCRRQTPTVANSGLAALSQTPGNPENARRVVRESGGPSDATSASSRSSAALPLAPTIRFTGSPSLNRIIVGIDTTWKSRAVAGLASTSSLATVSCAGLLGGDLLEHRGDHLARAAPGGPEIDQYRGAAGQHVLGERVVGDGDGSGSRRSS